MSFLGNWSCCPAVATVCPADLGQRGFPQLPGRCRRPARGGAGGRGLRRRARVPRRPLAICRWTWSLVDLEAQGWLGLWVSESASVLDSTQDKVFWIKKKSNHCCCWEATIWKAFAGSLPNGSSAPFRASLSHRVTLAAPSCPPRTRTVKSRGQPSAIRQDPVSPERR